MLTLLSKAFESLMFSPIQPSLPRPLPLPHPYALCRMLQLAHAGVLIILKYVLSHLCLRLSSSYCLECPLLNFQIVSSYLSCKMQILV